MAFGSIRSFNKQINYMPVNSKKNRRQFLRNTTLATLGLGVLPKLSSGRTSQKPSQSEVLNCDKTTLDYYGEGPFYTANPPVLQNNQLADPNEPGTRLILSGRVFNLDCNEWLPDTAIDIWHANDAGAYDNSGFNLRGKVTTNSQGIYIFETIKPGKYLNGSQFRPSHIHFKITPPGFNTLITQLYFEGDTDIPADAAASISSGTYDATHRIIPITLNGNGVYEGTWDIIINGDGITGTHDIHLDKGILYKISPNPFSSRVEIQYGVFRKAKVSLVVFNLEGQLVATLEEQELQPEKYTAVWEPEASLPNGYYFIALKINDLQVHYLKTMRLH
jgi:protocatechuate 3,4-dioxygenase beta subunit